MTRKIAYDADGRPNAYATLADGLRAAGVEPLTAANILADVGHALNEARQWDDMARWRAEQEIEAPQ